ncbi:MAG: alpha-glucosidase/alpha-galactosidase [Lachnospiraceae bacterium]|nr:alpha-glucosidase/alpha-galactosidase [Lachnospiraceae bacterium]
MEYDEKRCDDIQICYIGGGSQGWAWKLMSDLYLEEAISGTIRLYDIDMEAARANEAIGNRLFAYEGAKSKWNFITASSLAEGLTGADFVIISILPAGFEEMRSDVHEPEAYGIWQSVGDTVGPGGIFRALRTIPMYEVIARAVRTYCPKAWVINYTNPMSICTGALYRIFPDIKAFGCCHEVFGAQRLLLMALREELGIEEDDRHKLRTNVAGINHFTWITEASYQKMDLFPIYARFVEKHYQEGICDKVTDFHFMSQNKVKFDLFRRYGVIAAAGDRHLAEFVPEYLKNPETVEAWGYALTPVDYRIDNKRELNEKSRAYASGEMPIPIEPSGEEGVAQMKALLGLGEIVTNVNLPNKGQLEAPHEIVVETNALFSRDSVKPIMAGALPDGVKLLMGRHMQNQEMILKAALERDTQLAFGAFLNDPIAAQLNLKQAKELFSRMFENTRQYLPDYESLR